MELYLIRHADAVPLGEDGIEDDEDRPLSAVGLAQCSPLAAALQRQGVRLEAIVSSPLLRARQTAEGLLKHLAPPTPEVQVCEHVAPEGKRRKLSRFLRGLGKQSIAVVGHQPDLSLYVGWLIGSKIAQVELAKAGVACVHFDDEPDKDSGALAWLVTPQWCQ